jgi:hypothetical protein
MTAASRSGGRRPGHGAQSAASESLAGSEQLERVQEHDDQIYSFKLSLSGPIMIIIIDSDHASLSQAPSQAGPGRGFMPRSRGVCVPGHAGKRACRAAARAAAPGPAAGDSELRA